MLLLKLLIQNKQVLLYIIRAILPFVSQFCPENPGRQQHSADPAFIKQVPPFEHAEPSCSHGLAEKYSIYQCTFL